MNIKQKKLVKELVEAPGAMRILADYLDSEYGDAGTGKDIAQQDLRKWATTIEMLMN